MGDSVDYPDHSSGAADESAEAAPKSSDPWVLDPSPEDLIDDPIEFIFADHHRQRQAAIMLNMIASGEVDEGGLRNLIAFMKGDFALHIADEELGFFPLLKERCLPEDKIEELIARLVDEHKDDEAQSGAVIDLLEKRLAGTALDSKSSGKISAFAEHILQHLAVENAVLLPIARVRMDGVSLKALSDMLRERRVAQ